MLHEYSKIKNYPLWSLKYTDDPEMNDEIRIFIDNLMKVVLDPESMKNPSLLDDTVSGHTKYKMELGNILMDSRDNFRKGFNAYMKSIDIVNVQDNELDNARQYLEGHLQSEVGLWTEEEVKDKLKDWRMSQQAPAAPVVPGETPVTPTFNPPVDEDKLEKKRGEALERLESCPDLKKALEDFIKEEDYYTIDTLLKYV